MTEEELKRKRIDEDMRKFCKEKNIPVYNLDDFIKFMDETGKCWPWPTPIGGKK